jgi:hypothetical protein
MTLETRPATILLLVLCSTSSAWAQPLTEAGDLTQGRLKPGDRVVVTTTDGRQGRGRLVESRHDGLLVDVDRRHAAFAWSEIEQVRRRRNGVLLGAIIGTAAGAVAAIPVYQLAQNETGDGGKDLAFMIALGLGTGVAIDALLGKDTTVYRRRAVTSRIHVRPERGGGVVHLRVAW